MESIIVSAIPGIFYRKPSPEEDEFVKEGDRIKNGDVMGIVEVMKTYYEIKAEKDGIIDRFLVSNEELINAGQEIAVIKGKLRE